MILISIVQVVSYSSTRRRVQQTIINNSINLLILLVVLSIVFFALKKKYQPKKILFVVVVSCIDRFVQIICFWKLFQSVVPLDFCNGWRGTFTLQVKYSSIGIPPTNIAQPVHQYSTVSYMATELGCRLLPLCTFVPHSDRCCTGVGVPDTPSISE